MRNLITFLNILLLATAFGQQTPASKQVKSVLFVNAPAHQNSNVETTTHNFAKVQKKKCSKTPVFSHRKMMGERRRLHGSDATRTIRDACAQLLHAKVSEPDRAGHEFFQKGKSADILPSQKSCENNCV